MASKGSKGNKRKEKPKEEIDLSKETVQEFQKMIDDLSRKMIDAMKKATGMANEEIEEAARFLEISPQTDVMNARALASMKNIEQLREMLEQAKKVNPRAATSVRAAIYLRAVEESRIGGAR